MISFKQIYSSSLFRKSFIYVFCDGINKAIPFLLLPFITHYLTPADYGIVTNINVYIQVISVFCYTCSVGVIPVVFYKLDKAELQKYISTIIIINIITLLLCCILSIFISHWIDRVLNISVNFQILSLISILFSGVTSVNMILWRCEEKAVAFGSYQISQSAVNALSTIVFVIILLMGWKGRVYSMILTSIIFGLFSLYLLYKEGYVSIYINKKYAKQLLVFAIPLIPHALSFWFKSGIDKIMLTNMTNLTSNGLYSVSLTWGGIISMFLTAFSNAYNPYIFKKLSCFDKCKDSTVNEQRRLVKLIYGMILLIFIFSVIMFFISFVLIQIMYDDSYYGSLQYLPWIMLAQFFQGVYLLFVCFIHYSFKTKILGIITLSSSLLQVGITYLMILYVGSIGAAISSALGGLFMTFLVVRYAMSVYKLPWFNISYAENTERKQL